MALSLSLQREAHATVAQAIKEDYKPAPVKEDTMLPSDYVLQGWCQGRWQKGDKVCPVKAMEIAGVSLAYRHLVIYKLGVASLYGVMTWNDAKGRRK